MHSRTRPFLVRVMLASMLPWLVVPTASAQGNVIVPHPPILPDRPPGRVITTPLEVQYQRIYADLTDGVAVVEVRQTFRNPLPQMVEGQYVFPLPDGAAVGDFEMKIDGKVMKGEVLDKDAARRTYAEIVRRTRDPALLEFLGNRLYQTSVFPISAGAAVDVRLTYTRTLDEQGGLGLFEHPLRPRGGAETSSLIGELTVQVKLKSTPPLTSVFSPSHKCDIRRSDDHEATISFEQTRVRPDRDFSLYYQRKDAQFGLSLLTHRSPGEPGYFLLRISPRVEIAAEQTQPKDIAFVVDTSGSMGGDKIAQARRALKFAIQSLAPQDRFNILTFSTDVRPFRDGLVSAEADVRAAATEFAEQIQAAGGTNINQALLRALRDHPRDPTRPYLVVFLTDGQPTVDVTDPEQILRNVTGANAAGPHQVRLHVLGVGSDVNTHLLDKLAEASRGARDYCTETEDLELKLSAFVTRLASPVLTDLKLSFGGLKTHDVYPRELPDLFRGNDVVVLGRYEGGDRHAVTLDGRLLGDARQFSFDGDFSAAGRSNEFLPRLWANRKVAYLLDEIRLRGSNRELVDEVIRLATRYGIVTPYTSALVLEDERPLASAAEQGLRAYVLRADEGGGRVERARQAIGGRGAPAAASGEEATIAAGDLARLRELGYIGEPEKAFGLEDSTGHIVLRSVGDRTFVWDAEHGRYIDTAWDGKLAARAVKAFSDEYFRLLTEKPELARYLAIAERVLLLLDGAAIEVLPADEPRPAGGP